MGERVRGPRLVAAHGADAAQERELVAQVRAHHLGPVGRDGHAHPGVEERSEDVADLVGARERAGQEVGRRAHLEHDARAREQRGELAVGGRQDAVPDAIRSQRLDDLADLLGEPLLAAMHRHAEPGRARLLDERGERRVREAAAAGPRARDVDADDPARGVAARLLDDDLVLAVVERAIHHQDHAGAHLGVLEAGAIDAAQRRQDDVVEVALAAAIALHRVEAHLAGRDALRAVAAADHAVHAALDRERARLDQLGHVVDLIERVEPVHAARIRDRDHAVELPVVARRQRDALRVRRLPHHVGRHRPAEMRVQLGHRLVGREGARAHGRSLGRVPDPSAQAASVGA